MSNIKYYESLKLVRRHKNILERRSTSEKIIFGAVFVVFLFYAATLVYPFVWILINSFKIGVDYSINISLRQPFALPETWTFDNYVYAFNKMEYNDVTFVGMIINSVWYTGVTAFNGVIVSTLIGYALSKFRFRGRNLMFGVAIFSMTIPIIGTLGAAFRLYSDLGLQDNPLFAVVSSLGGIGMGFFIMYGFFSNVSWSYAEAVYIDGGGDFIVLFKVMMPIAFAPMSVLFILSAIGSWNDYMTILLYLPSYPTIASGLYGIEQTLIRTGNTPVYFAALLISIIPVIMLFTTCSDLIMKNFTVGGLKG